MPDTYFEEHLPKTAFSLHTHHSLQLIRFTLYSAHSSSSSLLLLRSSHPEVFYKKGVLRYFAKITWKHLCQSLFLNKVTGLRPATLLKKKFWHKCFPVNFAKFLRTPFVTEQLWWLLLTIVNISDVFFFGSNLKCFKEFKSGISISLKSLSLVLFSFSMFFLSFSVLFHFFLLLLIKRILLSWEFIKMFLPTLTSLKYVHLSK